MQLRSGKFTSCLTLLYIILLNIALCKIFLNKTYGVTISPEKIFFTEKKSIALYSYAHTLYWVYG